MFSIRPGQGRARSTKVPLKHGVLDQETTGPGGFAMALRTIPAMVGYGRLIEGRRTRCSCRLPNQQDRDAGAARPHGVRAIRIDGPISMRRSGRVPGVPREQRTPTTPG
jgi:hypothetical protein